MPIIEVKDLKKIYKTHKRKQGLLNAIKSIIFRRYVKKEALKGVTFKINKGEIVGIIGPNGAGKSTLIKILCGILHPTDGYVKALNYIPWKNRIEYVKNIGAVLGQKEQLYWDLPPLDTFYLNKELYGISKNVFRKRLKLMVKLLNLEEVIGTPVRDLSLGERMKCKIILSLLHKPKLVFLDEPTIGLDIISKENFREFIKKINKIYGTTFLITTHDLQDIERLCERVIIINSGKIIYDGSLAKLKEKIRKKVIEIKFEQKKAPRIKLKNCKIEKSDYKLKIEIDTKKHKVKDVLSYITKNYEFLDLVVKDPDIEEIVKEIYEHEKI